MICKSGNFNFLKIQVLNPSHLSLKFQDAILFQCLKNYANYSVLLLAYHSWNVTSNDAWIQSQPIT